MSAKNPAMKRIYDAMSKEVTRRLVREIGLERERARLRPVTGRWNEPAPDTAYSETDPRRSEARHEVQSEFRDHYGELPYREA